MKKEIKKASCNPLVTFKKLTIASTTIAWIAFVLAVSAAVVIYILTNGKEESNIQTTVNIKGLLILTIPVVFGLATLGLTIGQSVFAKRVGQLTPKIGFEQVICILVMFVGLSIIALSFVPHFYQLAQSFVGDKIIIQAYYEFGFVCAGIGAIFLLGASVYNTVLCAKVRVKK